MKVRYLISSVVMTCLLSVSLYAQVLVHTTDVTCAEKEDGKAMLTISNAPGPYKINWFRGEEALPLYKDKQQAVKLKGGSYRVEITDKNDCMIEREFEIEEPPAISVSITSTTGSFSYCGAKSFPEVYIKAQSSGGTPPMNCDDPICVKRVSGPGEYSFTIVDANGCQATKSVRVNWIGIVCASDPNDITGPAGFSEPKWVKAADPLLYTIRFENDPVFATAPAQFVRIEHVFDPKINPFSLRLGNFGFGSFEFELSLSSTFHQQRIDLQSELGLYVDVVAGIDVIHNKAFWTFQSIDPLTGLPPIDPQFGFLPVNDSLIGNGEGFVSFTLTPKSNVATGDTVSASAEIVFDVNEAIGTNRWTNKLDAHAPTSILNPLDSLTDNPEILLTWSGIDDPGGCGILDYALYYQENDGPFILQGEGIEETSIVFEGNPGSTYGFYIVATDNVGNAEQKTLAEHEIVIAATDRIEIRAPFADPLCTGDSLHIEWVATNIDSLSLSMSIDSGETFTLLAVNLEETDSSWSVFLLESMVTNFAQLMFRSLEDTDYIVKSLFFPIKPLPVVNATGDESICDNEGANLIAAGANTYAWTPGVTLDDSLSALPTAYPDITTTYYLIGNDVFGCQNTDSITVTVLPTFLDSIISEICDGDSIFVGGAYQTEAGFYTDELVASTGCDSTIVTEVLVGEPCPFPSPVVYVDEDAMGLNNGTSWLNAFNDLQDALAAVEQYENVNEIWIAEGTYYTTSDGDREISFLLRDSVEIYGGFVGNETMREERSSDPSLVLVSGDIGVPADSTDNAYHVFRGDASCIDCIVDGMTMQFGQADFIFNQAFIGGGLLNEGTLLLNNCVLERNTAMLEGAAIYNSGTSADLIIRDCIFRLNTSGLERDILNIDGADIRFQGLIQIQE